MALCDSRGRRFKSCPRYDVMSQDIGDSRACECRSCCCSFRVSGGALRCSGGLVVAAGVEDQFAEEFADGGDADSDLQVLG